ncbi:hypothetical protein HD806DRAFT_128296 [Xylariaceae sp. AK1471]|nr:hypothetical protein HD806DRAFT_128296 [Xylariaceae sp. AK1471]
MSGNLSSQPLTMTPELERILARGRHIHPTMPDNWTGDMSCYDETMDPILPSLDDKRGILRFLGLNDNMINWALEKYQVEHEPGPGKQPDYEALVAKFTLVCDHEIIEGHKFPLIDRLWDIVRGRDTELSLDLEENYDGFVRGGLREGLRPEFALFCGLHPSEESYRKETYREYYYIQGYQEQTDSIITTWAGTLSNLWRQKLELAGAISGHRVTPRTSSREDKC